MLAVPAAASHHPPNSVSGLVAMTVTRPGSDLVFTYTVTQQPCPNVETGCYQNYGKPYGKGTRKTGPAAPVRRTDCDEKEWAPLLARGQKIKLPNLTPLIRKILAERKAKKHVQAARDLKRLKNHLTAEAKALNAFWKAVKACR